MTSVNWRRTGIALSGAAALTILFYFQTTLFTSPLRILGMRASNQNPQPQRKKLVFTEDADGTILNRDGFDIDLRGFLSSDGNEVSYSISSPRGSARVTDKFEDEIARADYVVVREPLRSADGRHVGERAIILFQNTRTHKEVAAVLWTSSRSLHSIESGSLYHALEFEKQMNH